MEEIKFETNKKETKKEGIFTKIKNGVKNNKKTIAIVAGVGSVVLVATYVIMKTPISFDIPTDVVDDTVDAVKEIAE